jgi:hypothetical protein
MTPAELAKVTKAARDLGFTNAEVDACNGDQVALLALFASACSQVSRDQTGNGVSYGPRQPGRKTIKDIDDHVAKLATKVSVKVARKAA